MEDEVTMKWGGRQPTEPAWEHQDDAWAFEKPTYEWQQEFNQGDAPAMPELEAELFGEENRILMGIHFDKFSRINVSRKGGPERVDPLQSFEQAKLHPIILENIQRMGYQEPTPIQRNAIPILMKNYDLLACAQTGSGKTAAFLLPVLSKILTKMQKNPPVAPQPGARKTKASPLALIILPTRELGIQIFDETRRFTYKSPIRPAVIYGGADLRRQKDQLARGCDILIATPGRLVDAMERGAVALDKVRYLVLDEADRILDLGFEPTIRQILLSSDLTRDESLHTMMFSATFPTQIQVLARDFMNDYCRLRIGRIGGTTTDIMQKVIKVEEYHKEDTLEELLLSQPPSRTLIFVDTKRKADYLDDVLYNKHFPCISLHGDRSQRERELALEAFKAGRSPILIATAVAARGLDIKDVMHVINYDLSDDIDDYVHRIGRTARAGNPGLATTFYNSQNWAIAPQLVKLLIECQQEVPEFLQEFITDDVSYENDFVDPDQIDLLESREGGEGGGDALDHGGYDQGHGGYGHDQGEGRDDTHNYDHGSHGHVHNQGVNYDHAHGGYRDSDANSGWNAPPAYGNSNTGNSNNSNNNSQDFNFH
ncbi:MAG: P-loop containing nucleoside triphosphate hydrolase protein [Linnemannia elongata]|nr:MAG: P-loop containing nucleoside triphosphate hydrolase protein [Linnemannia elongata]